MTALAERDSESDTSKLAANVEQMEIEPSVISDINDIVMHRGRAIGRVLQQMVMRAFALRHRDPGRGRHRPGSGECVKIAVTPGFILARGESEEGHAAITSA